MTMQEAIEVSKWGQKYYSIFIEDESFYDLKQLKQYVNENMQRLKHSPTDPVYLGYGQALAMRIKDLSEPEVNQPLEIEEEEMPAVKEKESPWTGLVDALKTDITGQMDKAVKEKSKNIDAQLKEMRDAVRDNVLTLKVAVGEKPAGAITGLRHKQLEQLIQVATQKLPVLLVGMAGTGKTHAAAQVAEAMGSKFYAMSVGAQTSKSDIMGYMHAGGKYVRTHFRDAFEKGGVFLMDEIDAGNANVLIQVNAALSNNYCAFPDAMVERHEDFVFIASANTFGNGANRQYVGRNQLDAATLDRFTLIEWKIDDKLESVLAGEDDNQRRWYGTVKALRSAVEKEGLRVVVSPRATLRGSTLLAAGLDIETVSEMALIKLFPQDKQQWATEIGKKAYFR